MQNQAVPPCSGAEGGQWRRLQNTGRKKPQIKEGLDPEGPEGSAGQQVEPNCVLDRTSTDVVAAGGCQLVLMVHPGEENYWVNTGYHPSQPVAELAAAV